MEGYIMPLCTAKLKHTFSGIHQHFLAQAVESRTSITQVNTTTQPDSYFDSTTAAEYFRSPIGKSRGGCALFMTHLFTPISSSGDPQFQVNLPLRSPNFQYSPKKIKSRLNRLKSSYKWWLNDKKLMYLLKVHDANSCGNILYVWRIHRFV